MWMIVMFHWNWKEPYVRSHTTTGKAGVHCLIKVHAKLHHEHKIEDDCSLWLLCSIMYLWQPHWNDTLVILSVARACHLARPSFKYFSSIAKPMRESEFMWKNFVFYVSKELCQINAKVHTSRDDPFIWVHPLKDMWLNCFMTATFSPGIQDAKALGPMPPDVYESI